MGTIHMVRAEVLYSGCVQGVGFRFTARSTAGRYAVTGFVRNLSSGKVGLVAEGERAAVDAFLSELASLMEGNIDSAQVNWAPPTGEFKAFNIRF